MVVAFRGHCHCRSVEIEFESTLAADELGYRLCDCTYCRRLAPVYFADPTGKARIHVADPLGIYRFGHKTADFVHCPTCFVYVGAIFETGGRTFAILNARLFDNLPLAKIADAAFDYDAENTEDRIARRAQRWTPARLIEGARNGSA
ncbi:GFA family protein [Hyphobacterium sp.]|uniref:GFA family protein n=1 Tax=Hyphobacterium sp. TaxID=2004662 RepID=UPI003BAC946E